MTIFQRRGERVHLKSSLAFMTIFQKTENRILPFISIFFYCQYWEKWIFFLKNSNTMLQKLWPWFLQNKEEMGLVMVDVAFDKQKI